MASTPLRIVRFREAITKVVSILSEKSIVVTQEGTQAYVAYRKDGSIKNINLPYVPDDADDMMLDAIRGFLSHEVAHVLFTKPQDMPQYLYPKHERGKFLASLANILEDTRIEREMQVRFPGSSDNLAATFNFVAKEKLEPAIVEMKANGATKQALQFLLMPLMRSWAGQIHARSFLNRIGADSLIGDEIKKLEPFEGRIPTLASTLETTELALEILAVLDEPEEQEREQEGNDSGEDSGNADEDGDKSDSSSTLEQIEKAEDIDHTFSEALNQKIKQVVDSQTYLPFTTDYDKIIPVMVKPGCESIVDAEVVKASERVRGIVGQMQAHMRRLFAQQSVSVNYGGQRSGRLQASALHRLAISDDRVFSRREEHQATDTAISLVVDLSGSMLGGAARGTSKLRTACEAAYAMCQTLDRLGIKHEIVGFTTTEEDLPDEVLARAAAQKQELGRSFSRVHPICVYVFKSFADTLNSKVRRALVGVGMTRANGYSSLAEFTNVKTCENVDGESVMMAARRLLQRPEQRKVMLVLSDGQPSCGISHETIGQLQQHLRDVTVDVERMGIEAIGIGIQDESVTEYYPKNVVCHSVEDLPGVVMMQLRKVLIKR